MIQVDIANQQSSLSIDEPTLVTAIRSILEEVGVERGEISLAVVDDPEMHRLNREYLRHDYPTDVLSFMLEQEDHRLDGQLIVSSDTARTNAAEYGWAAESELLLYVIHGTLHLVGYEDDTPEAKNRMRDAERRHLARFELAPPWDKK